MIMKGIRFDEKRKLIGVPRSHGFSGTRTLEPRGLGHGDCIVEGVQKIFMNIRK